MWELNRQYHSLLQRLFRLLQTRNILPLNIRLITQNSSLQRPPQLFAIRIFSLRSLPRLFAPSSRYLAITPNSSGLLLVLCRLQVLLQFLGPLNVFCDLLLQDDFVWLRLFPFYGEHEEVQGGHVLFIGLVIVPCCIELDGLLDDTYGTANPVDLAAHFGELGGESRFGVVL